MVKMMASENKIIRVYYDFACPFCYVGNESAYRLEQEFGVDFEWIGWEIGPKVRKRGEVREKREHSFMIKRLAYDQNIVFSVPPVRANTRLAMEGAEYAKTQGKFREYFDRVMDEYWVRGTNISTLKTLVPIAESLGLDTHEFAEALRSGLFRDRVLDDDEAERLDIQYVPTFIFGGFRVVGNVPFYVLREAVNVYVRGYEPPI